MKESLPIDFEPNDFAIRVRPHMLGDIWYGAVDISIMWDGSNVLSEDDFVNLMHLTKMICASVPLMEENPHFRNNISDFVDSVYDHVGKDPDIQESTKPIAEVVAREGNVIKLSFNTKTKGSA